jgi:hypothetical protein
MKAKKLNFKSWGELIGYRAFLFSEEKLKFGFTDLLVRLHLALWQPNSGKCNKELTHNSLVTPFVVCRPTPFQSACFVWSIHVGRGLVPSFQLSWHSLSRVSYFTWMTPGLGLTKSKLWRSGLWALVYCQTPCMNTCCLLCGELVWTGWLNLLWVLHHRSYTGRLYRDHLKLVPKNNNMWPALAKGGSWGQILKMSCWYGLILHKIIFKMMYDTWQSLDNWPRYGLQNTSFSQVFGYNYFEKTSSKGKLGAYFMHEKH